MEVSDAEANQTDCVWTRLVGFGDGLLPDAPVSKFHGDGEISPGADQSDPASVVAGASMLADNLPSHMKSAPS
jgi:hypothetical protein